MTDNLVWHKNWFGRETGLAGKLISQGSTFGRDFGLAEKVVSQGNLFLVKETKIINAIFVVK